MTCGHENFRAKVDVTRLIDTGRFTADVRIHCEDCGVPFEFLGLEPGSHPAAARVSVDGQEARLAIAPPGLVPNPLQRMRGVTTLS